MIEESKQYWNKKLPFYLDFLHKMVAINSFTENPSGVNELNRYTAKLFKGLGFSAEVIPSVHAHYGSHLVLTKEGKREASIGLISHLDTVFTKEEEEKNNFRWREEGDRIYGPGTNDIKGGTMMIYMLLDALKHLATDYFEGVTWKILLDASEEDDARDFGKICLDQLSENGVAGLVFECGNIDQDKFSLVVARKGRAMLKVSVDGKSAHAGTDHHKGASAILQLSEAIKTIETVTDYARDITVNVGMVSGGLVTNRVPHHAEAFFEMRAFSRDAYDDAMKQLLELKDLSIVTSYDEKFSCHVEVQCLRETPPWPRNEQTDHLFSIWKKTAEYLGYSGMMEERGGVSDANLICHKIPVIDGLGPAGDNSHCSVQSDDGTKEQEYISISSIIPKASHNLLAICHLIDSLS